MPKVRDRDDFRTMTRQIHSLESRSFAIVVPISFSDTAIDVKHMFLPTLQSQFLASTSDDLTQHVQCPLSRKPKVGTRCHC